MSQQAIGRILLMPKGTYDASVTYNSLDWVRYNGKAWVCKANNTIGVAPSESATWTLLAQDGSGGTGSGDMQKAVYDTNDDGVVDAAATLSGLTSSITQLNYLNTATSDIQTQISSKIGDNPTFSQAGSRTNIASGESISTLFGKIMKWFADLKDLAFIEKDGVSSTKYLRGDGTWQTFPTVPNELSDLTGDVSISSPSQNQILQYNGSKWANASLPVSIAGNGTASASATHQQQVTVNGLAVDIDGTKYMESTANSASFVFSNASITATSAIDVYSDTWGDNPSASGGVVASAGSCTVTFDSAQTRTVRIYIK